MSRDEQLETTGVSIMAEAETEAAAPPSLMEAYGDQSLGGEDQPKKREENQPQRNTKLHEERTTADSVAESERRPLPKREQTLSEAHDGVTPDEDAELIIEEDGLPESLQGFDIDAVVATMLRLGLTNADLQDERWVNVLRSTLESELGDPDSEGAEDEAEETTEENKDDKKPEEPKAAAPVHAEMQPEDVKKYVETTWEKAQQINHPVMSKLFEDSLATALDTAPEHRELLHNVCELLSYGGTSLVQSAVPAMVDEYMQANFLPNLMRNFGHVLEAHVPGIGASFNEAQAANTWDAVRGENETFADLPDFESKEFCELRDKIRAAAPWIDSWDPDPNMPPLQALKAKAQLFARLAVGERVDPKKIQQQIADALVTGKRSAEKSTRRVSASRMLGRGRTAGTIGEQKERSGLMDAWNAQHGHEGGIA